METIGKSSAASFRPSPPPPQQAHKGYGLPKPEPLSPKRQHELYEARPGSLWLLSARPPDIRRDSKRSYSDDDDEPPPQHDDDEGSCEGPRDLSTTGPKRIKSEPDTSDSCLSPSGSSGSGSPAPSLGAGSTGSGVSIPRPKPKPPPIGPIVTSAALGSSLQTPIVTFASPFLPQSKTPLMTLPFWSPFALPSPRGYSGSGGTHFQFPATHLGLTSFPPLSPFLGHPYSPFDPQLLLSPSKSIPVLQ